MKKIISMLLVVVMLLGLMPLSALAADYDVTIKVDTTNTGTVDYTAVQPGTVLKIPVNIVSNDGVTAFALEAVYDTNVFEMIEGTDRFTVDDENCENMHVAVGSTAGENVVFDAKTAVRKTTGVFANINLRVKENAPVGKYTIGLKVLEPAANNFLYYDSTSNKQVAITPTLIAGEITVKYDTAGLSFVNGGQTMTYDEAKANAESGDALTGPEGSYFVGWFTGLDVEPTDGYYVIEPTETATFAGTETRPRYDQPPTEGTYNALWIKGEGSYVVNVGENSFTVYAGTDDKTVLSEAINGSNGQTTKLVKDMTLSASITTTAPMHLDMNGRTITVKASNILKLGKDNNVAESSRAGGTFAGGKNSYFTYSDQNYDTGEYIGGQFTVIRDLTMKGSLTSQTIKVAGADSILNCVFEGGISLLADGGETTIDNCKITASTSPLKLSYGVEATVTNTEMNAGTYAFAPIQGQMVDPATSTYGGSITLGEGNKLTATSASALFNNLQKAEILTVETSSYQIMPGGLVVQNGVATYPEGMSAAIDANGYVVFGVPVEVKYMADGSIVKTVEAMKGGYADLSVTHAFGDGTEYRLLGWSTDPNATEPMTQVLLEGDTTLYAVKRETGTLINGQEKLDGDSTLNGIGTDWPNSIANAHRLGDLDSLKLTYNSKYVEVNLTESILDSLAAKMTKGEAQIDLDYVDSGLPEGTKARMEISITQNGESVPFDGAVEVKILFTPEEDKNYCVYYIPETGEPVAMATGIISESGWTYAKFSTTHFSTFEVRETTIANGYTASLDVAETEARAGNQPVNVTVAVTHSAYEQYNAGEIKLSYDQSLLTFNAEKSTLPANATWKVVNDELVIEFYGAEIQFPHNMTLAFTTCESVNAETTATVTLTGAAFADSLEATKENLQIATLTVAEDHVIINLEEVAVEKEDSIVLGDETVVKGEPYTFTVAEPENYDYSAMVIKVGDEVITDKVEKNEDGSYTIPAEFVTGTITIEDHRTPKEYDLTIKYEGDDLTEEETNGSVEKVTYGTDYEFTLPTDETGVYKYSVSSVSGAEYTSADGKVTIAGNNIVDGIVITIAKDQTKFSVNVEGENLTTDEYEVTISGDDNSLDQGESVTLTIKPAVGYSNYQVTVTENGVEITDERFTNSGNSYTLSSVDGDIVFTITKSVAGTVEVKEYLTLNADDSGVTSLGMFLVLYTDPSAAGSYAPKCNDEEMYYSSEYGAYCYLVTATDQATAEANVKITAGTGTYEPITYTMNVNGSANTDAADAQLVFDMYMAKYMDFTDDVTMLKFLLADTNLNKEIDTEDAQTIINSILSITTENNG